MLNEKPKSKNNRPVTKGRLFWRIQKECFRRSVTVYLMYLFMSLLMLAFQAIDTDNTTLLEIGLGCICLAGGMAFNAHLCYHFGTAHYDAYQTGCLHRRNAVFGIESGGDHRVEREYRPWKGFLIGLYVGIVVIILGLLAGAYVDTQGGGYAIMFLSMLAGWAIIPVGWIRTRILPNFSYFWSIAFILIPILVSGCFYIVGAMAQKRKRQEEAARSAAVEEAAKIAKEPHVQTEEQRRKTLQSKKKK